MSGKKVREKSTKKIVVMLKKNNRTKWLQESAFLTKVKAPTQNFSYLLDKSPTDITNILVDMKPLINKTLSAHSNLQNRDHSDFLGIFDERIFHEVLRNEHEARIIK